MNSKRIVAPIFTAILCVFTCTLSSAQNGENPLPFEYQEPAWDTAAQYPGGSAKMMAFFREHIQYPTADSIQNNPGSVLLKIAILETGVTGEIIALNGVPGSPHYVAEAIRVLRMMPTWIPATKNGNAVACEMTISVPFGQ